MATPDRTEAVLRTVDRARNAFYVAAAGLFIWAAYLFGLILQHLLER